MRLGLRRVISAGLGVAALGALVVLLAGCGGKGTPSRKAESTPAHLQHGRVTAAAYKQHLSRINQQNQAAINSIRARLQKAKNVSQVRAALLAFANAQIRIGTQVGLILPPKKAAKANQLLARGFRDSAVQLKALIPRLGKFKNPRLALLMIAHHRPRGGEEIDQAVTQLKHLGLSPSSKATGGAPPSQHH